MDLAVQALNRFGLGARVGERRAITDPRGWLRAQLESGAPRLEAPDVAAPGAIGDAVRSLRGVAKGDEAARRDARRRLVEIGAAETRAALSARLASERPFVERLVAFWSNHLCVSVRAKLLVAPFAGSYEREVIRPHVLGRFEDMVLASARHPAMLVYLDNFQSIGPASAGARFGRRNGNARRGLNENYARELLELHTLGVGGGYTQQDVQELARILTGWTIEGLGLGGGRGRRPAPEPGSPIRFRFEDLLHEPGAKTVLGVRYGEAGVAEGERAIRALCAHPSTATFVARKLVTHFVADDPPPAAVERVAGAFRASGGQLAAVTAALIDAPESWNAEARKFRSPQDWLVAVLRALGARESGPYVPVALRQLRQPLWSPQAPKGYGDRLDEWADPDSLLNRAELARTIARRPAIRAVDPASLLEVAGAPGGGSLARALGDSKIPSDERVALALAGPEFQWR